MTYEEWLKKITIDPETMGGNACFSGTRVTIARIAHLAKQSCTYAELFSDYPFLSTEDVKYSVIYFNKNKLKNL